MTTVHCPTCGTPVEWTDAARYRPFCCRRCKLIDLGEWLDERHRIPGEPADETTIDPEWRDEDDLP